MSHRGSVPSSRADEALEQLSTIALREHSMSTLLQRVAELSNSMMPGKTDTSVSLLIRGRPTTPAATGELATQLDEVQFAIGAGPCLHAARTGDIVEIPDTRLEQRWPGYARRAAQHGNLSSLSVPLPVDDGFAGAITTYAGEPDAFAEEHRSVAVRFVPYAAVAIANMQTYQHAREMADNLQTALETRAIIDQAKGILIERYKVTVDQAFQMLAKVSMGTNRKLRDVADELVRTGTLPLPRRPRETLPNGPTASARGDLEAAAASARGVARGQVPLLENQGSGTALSSRRWPPPQGRRERPVPGGRGR